MRGAPWTFSAKQISKRYATVEPHRFLDITTIPLVLPTRYPLLNGLSPVKDTLQRHTWSPIAHVRCVKILIFLYLLWFSLFQVSNENCETMES